MVLQLGKNNSVPFYELKNKCGHFTQVCKLILLHGSILVRLPQIDFNLLSLFQLIQFLYSRQVKLFRTARWCTTTDMTMIMFFVSNWRNYVPRKNLIKPGWLSDYFLDRIITLFFATLLQSLQKNTDPPAARTYVVEQRTSFFLFIFFLICCDNAGHCDMVYGPPQFVVVFILVIAMKAYLNVCKQLLASMSSYHLNRCVLFSSSSVSTYREPLTNYKSTQKKTTSLAHVSFVNDADLVSCFFFCRRGE